MKIEEIKNPNFLKKLNNKELDDLSSQIREFLISNISKTGGHLSSNLGIVELTVALLKVFDANKDIILFDVGHECYTYKILTGRSQKFSTLRQKGGLSGFQSMKESTYDHYEAGHSSTSISTGLGYAIASKLDNKNNNIISVIGDGSISNGLSYEALNHLGDTNVKQIIILNDNQMSISKNVGGLHNFLDEIRSLNTYESVKENTKQILNKNKIGKFIFNKLHGFKKNLKKIYVNNGSFFTDLGIEYYGPINGHDYKELIKYLNIAKNEKKSVLLHVITQKGKGYEYAFNDKIGKFHGVGAFDVQTGEMQVRNILPSFSEIISDGISDIMKVDKDIICITPAMSYGSKLDNIRIKFPKRFIDVGIAEEHAIVLANGLALAGKKPYVFIYSTFLQRGYDEVNHDVARMNSNVTFLIDRAGFVSGDGVSHQGLYDIPMLLSVPNMVITMPKDSIEARNLLLTSSKYNGPFVIRYPKISLDGNSDPFEILKIGSWEILKEGIDAWIISYGVFVNNALEIAKLLKNDSLKVGVVNARFIKPMDTVTLTKILETNKPIIVYEESMEIGSLGSYISLYSHNNNFKNKINIFGVKDEFLTHASRDELIEMQNLDINSMYVKIKNILK